MIHRRNLLRGLGGIAMVPTFMQSLAAEEARGDGQTIIVSILLSGGNDGLNTVVPLQQYGSYVKLRTPATPPANLALAYSEGTLQTLAFDATTTTSPGQATTYGFAPGMDAMRLLYAEGHLAVIAGVGLPKAETNPLSHQNGVWDWLTGQINVEYTPSAGWLGMSLSKSGGSLGPTVSFTGASPIINSSTTPGLVINSPMDGFGVTFGNSDTYDKLLSTFSQLAMQPQATSTGTFNQGRLGTALTDISIVKGYAKKNPASGYALPTGLDYQLRDVARMIEAGSGIRGFFVSQGGYDTHSSQALTQPMLLNQLSESIAQFYYYLQSKGLSQNVVIMTMSDFGRRPFANLTFGTDHGGSSVSFVLGDRVKGGVYGTYPSLKKFDANQNLALSVDFRNVLSDLIVSAGGNPTPILGETWPSLGFI